MTIGDIKNILECKVICCEDRLNAEINTACGSDMMSDVLAFVKDQSCLLTGLVNPQVVRTADMMDMHCIVFVRSKIPTEEMKQLAKDSSMVLLATKMRMYEACGKLYSSGLGSTATKSGEE